MCTKSTVPGAWGRWVGWLVSPSGYSTQRGVKRSELLLMGDPGWKWPSEWLRATDAPNTAAVKHLSDFDVLQRSRCEASSSTEKSDVSFPWRDGLDIGQCLALAVKIPVNVWNGKGRNIVIIYTFKASVAFAFVPEKKQWSKNDFWIRWVTEAFLKATSWFTRYIPGKCLQSTLKKDGLQNRFPIYRSD